MALFCKDTVFCRLTIEVRYRSISTFAGPDLRAARGRAATPAAAYAPAGAAGSAARQPRHPNLQRRGAPCCRELKGVKGVSMHSYAAAMLIMKQMQVAADAAQRCQCTSPSSASAMSACGLYLLMKRTRLGCLQGQNGSGLASAMAGAPPGGPAAFRSLSHETTIVCESPCPTHCPYPHVCKLSYSVWTVYDFRLSSCCVTCPSAGLDGGGTDSPGADQIRDPFAASFGNFQPPGVLPEQRGFSGHAGGATPFAGLQHPPQQPPQQSPQQQQPQQRPQAAAPPQPVQGGPALRVATRPPLGPSRMAASGSSGGGGGHSRAGSFSKSLDILAAKLGLSGPIGPNGQPVFAGEQPQQQAQQQPRPPQQRSDWTFNNMAWNLPAQQGQPRLPPQQQVECLTLFKLYFTVQRYTEQCLLQMALKAAYVAVM